MVTRLASGALEREIIQNDWDLPSSYWPAPLPLRHVQFATQSEGFALCASWPRDDPAKSPEELPPPLVGLARTEDGGRRWNVVETWEGPRSSHPNVRHVLTLEVS